MDTAPYLRKNDVNKSCWKTILVKTNKKKQSVTENNVRYTSLLTVFSCNGRVFGLSVLQLYRTE